jgi:hypothetical protein
MRPVNGGGEMTQKKDAIDSIFDFADKIVDGAAAVLKDVPEPDSDEEPDYPRFHKEEPKRVIDVPEQPLLKSDGHMGKKQPREVTLNIRAISKRQRGGVAILAETPTHDVVVINLEEKDWKTLCDNADWMRMVKD